MGQKLGNLYRALKLAGGIAKWGVVFRLAKIAARFRNPHQVISVWPEVPIKIPPRLAIFMHFDSKGRVSAPAIFHIKQLVAGGYAVVFVTNSGKLTETGAAALRELCTAIFIRRNSGYDFCAWRDVMEALRLPTPDMQELLIVNDSMYGPLRPLETVLTKLDYAQADIWGLTESWQHRYHLQSFFLGFGPKALHSVAFAKFWRDIQNVPFKSYIVREYEVGFTQKMLQAGLRCRAIWKYEELISQVLDQKALDDIARAERHRSARGDPVLLIRKLQIHRIRDAVARQIALNPTADLWRQLLLNGFPFIKRELLRKNPAKVEDIGEWLTVVRSELGLDPEPILAELRGGLKNRAP